MEAESKVFDFSSKIDATLVFESASEVSTPTFDLKEFFLNFIKLLETNKIMRKNHIK